MAPYITSHAIGMGVQRSAPPSLYFASVVEARCFAFGCVSRRRSPCADGQCFESLPYPGMRFYVALNHERHGRLGCLVRMARIEWWSRIVLDGELDGLRNLWPGE